MDKSPGKTQRIPTYNYDNTKQNERLPKQMATPLAKMVLTCKQKALSSFENLINKHFLNLNVKQKNI